ncbi:MAG: ferredoxin--NADP reductase [Deltaproteobacteria bacterium]|nr:ferredoxin--NADP reductase [Deltaproteobacteria bacterium]
MSVEFHELEVSAVIRETAECSSFELRVPAHLAGAYRYKAGQHLTFKLPWEGLELTRCYSLSSCPEAGEALKIAVKRVEDGRISNWLNGHVKAGDTLLASVPEGRFVLDPDTRASTPLVLLAGGSGITPIISILKSALLTTKRPVTVLYANQTRASVIYGDELRRLADRHPDRLALHHHIDSESGLLSPAAVRALVPSNDIAEFYICGPEPFMELIERTLRDAGVHEELIYIERFVSPADPDRASRSDVDFESLDAPESFSLWLGGRSRTVPYLKGKTLLECAQAAGLSPAHSCESGFCGSCMSAVKTGAVHMRTHDALSARDVERGVALLCQSVPASAAPLELDADSTSFRAASAVKSSYSKTWSRLAAATMFALMVAGTLVLRLVH